MVAQTLQRLFDGEAAAENTARSSRVGAVGVGRAQSPVAAPRVALFDRWHRRGHADAVGAEAGRAASAVAVDLIGEAAKIAHRVGARQDVQRTVVAARRAALAARIATLAGAGVQAF